MDRKLYIDMYIKSSVDLNPMQNKWDLCAGLKD